MWIMINDANYVNSHRVRNFTVEQAPTMVRANELEECHVLTARYTDIHFDNVQTFTGREDALDALHDLLVMQTKVKPNTMILWNTTTKAWEVIA